MQIHPLLAVGVFVSTAATDAAYVFFNAAVSAKKRVPAATWSSVVPAVRLRGDQLHQELDVRGLRGFRLMGRRLLFHDPSSQTRSPSLILALSLPSALASPRVES
jgi:hypothetical protein